MAVSLWLSSKLSPLRVPAKKKRYPFVSHETLDPTKAVTVKVGTFSEMRFLTNEVMNDFMRVQERARRIPQHLGYTGTLEISVCSFRFSLLAEK